MLRDPTAPAQPNATFRADARPRGCVPFLLQHNRDKYFQFFCLVKENGEKPSGPGSGSRREPPATALQQTACTGDQQAPLRGAPQGEDLRSVSAVCTVCKLIFLLAAIKIKDLGIYCKRYYQFYVLAFLCSDQGINPAFSACL